jgi:antitoxin VapB
MNSEHDVKLFRDGDSQAVRIPHEFELPGENAVMRKVGDKLIIEVKKPRQSIIELLDSWEPIDEPFPEINDPPTKPENIF